MESRKQESRLSGFQMTSTQSLRKSGDKAFVCPNICGKSYKYKQSMMLHFRYECGQEPRFMCYPPKGWVFSNDISGLKMFECLNNCGKRYKYKQSMLLHFRNECGKSPAYQLSSYTEKGGLFACLNNCGRIYKYKRSMMLHYKKECGREPQYRCSICLKKFAHQWVLRQHVALRHNLLSSSATANTASNFTSN
ncbi:RB-associated KRAB zinc finger protein-like [Planococcus citri]|uniref:RB-associated KRAB zinc finger protein-like n=1 Tax=Planococcus citri TaxID=170843 RepID=UPI0031F99CD2